MFNFLKGTPREPNTTSKGHDIPEGKALKVEYFSNDVPIPDDFLPVVSTAEDARPMTMTPVDWKTTAIPEYEGRYAVVLDNVLSPSECDELIRLAEASVDSVRIGDNKDMLPKEDGDGDDDAAAAAAARSDPWSPAMVNAGNGYEVLDTTYRHSDRIIWDHQDVVDRLWARCLAAGEGEGDVGRALREQLAVLEGPTGHRMVGGYRKKGDTWDERWEMRQLNQRMRFLRYGPGQFFQPHCDSVYSALVGDKFLRTVFTLHLYLNDSVAEAGDAAALVGGATSFLSSNDQRKVDVDPKAGRVLIFQHSGLNHSGDRVTKGVKYTMRTEIMYEKVRS